MRVLLQRVKNARVEIDNQSVGEIKSGLLLFVGIEQQDDENAMARMAERVLSYRVFADQNGKMNLNVRDAAGGVLAVSQFTLAADTGRGLRPSFSRAAAPESAKALYEAFVDRLRTLHQPVATGVFAADMQVHLVNDGPVTFLLEM